MHPFMVLDEAELTKRRVVPGKFTMLMATNQARISLFMSSILSLLIRTKDDSFLEHINVVINGPDRRTGDPTLQDQKQSFLEELRDMKWEPPSGLSRPMPLTVMRVWSRVGHGECLDMAVPWVHTEYYGTMHDDLVILNPDCMKIVQEAFQSTQAVWALPKPTFYGRLAIENQYLGFPHMHSVFVCFHTPPMMKMRHRWAGYSVPMAEGPPLVNWEEFNRHYKTFDPLSSEIKSTDVIRGISQDIGAWLLFFLTSEGHRPAVLPDGMFFHVSRASWADKTDIDRVTADNKLVYEAFEKDLQETPYWPLYQKYKALEQPKG